LDVAKWTGDIEAPNFSGLIAGTPRPLLELTYTNFLTSGLQRF